MAVRTKNLQATETPLERFDRVSKRVLERDRKARMRKKDQPRQKSVTPAR